MALLPSIIGEIVTQHMYLRKQLSITTGKNIWICYWISAEAVSSIFGFNRSLFGFDKKKNHHWWNEIYQQREEDIQSAKTEL